MGLQEEFVKKIDINFEEVQWREINVMERKNMYCQIWNKVLF